MEQVFSWSRFLQLTFPAKLAAYSSGCVAKSFLEKNLWTNTMQMGQQMAKSDRRAFIPKQRSTGGASGAADVLNITSTDSEAQITETMLWCSDTTESDRLFFSATAAVITSGQHCIDAPLYPLRQLFL